MTPVVQTIAAFYFGGFAATLLVYARSDIEQAPSRVWPRLRLVITIVMSVALALAWPVFLMWRLVAASFGKAIKMEHDIVSAALTWYGIALRAKAGDTTLREPFKAAGEELFQAVERHIDVPLVRKLLLAGTEKEKPRG